MLNFLIKIIHNLILNYKNKLDVINEKNCIIHFYNSY